MSLRRDDYCGSSPITRREALAGAVVLGVALFTRSTAGESLARSHERASDAFMRLSSLLISHQLNRDVGMRIEAQLALSETYLQVDIGSLLDIARLNAATRVEEFFDAVPAGRIRQLALKIVSAWYLGVTEDLPGQTVCAFELALMYRPTLDVMPIPSYAISGPNGWNADAHSLNAVPEF